MVSSLPGQYTKTTLYLIFQCNMCVVFLVSTVSLSYWSDTLTTSFPAQSLVCRMMSRLEPVRFRGVVNGVVLLYRSYDPPSPPHTLTHSLLRAGVQLPEDGTWGGGLLGGGLRLRQHYALCQEHLLQVGGAVDGPSGEGSTSEPNLLGCKLKSLTLEIGCLGDVLFLTVGVEDF